jgi:membrane protease YdiL (CAAX protease family)
VSLLPLFVDSQYEIRSGWKFALYCVILVALFIATGIVVSLAAAFIDPGWLLASPTDPRFLTLNAIVLFIRSMGAVVIMAWFVDRVPLRVFGITFHERWLRDVGLGLAVAAGMIAVVIVGGILLNGIQVEVSTSAATIPAIVGTVMVLALAAFNEELVFRGYPFQVLLKGIGPWPTMLLLSSIFALIHLGNPGASLLSTLNTAIAGIFLSLAYMQTRSIWLPYGIHFGWNMGTAVVLGVPVSGIDTVSLLNTQLRGPEFISGGIYGPENSILGTLVFLGGAIVIRRIRTAKVSPEVHAALVEHSSKVYIEKT